jgi:molybdenum cofactor cytidylyltransferase
MDVPTVLVLASGRGERFLASGGQTHKLQALLGGQNVLAHTLAAVQASGLPWHLEQADHPGMGDTIAAAVRATPDARGWMVLPADLPLVRPDTLRLVAGWVSGCPVVRPVYQGRAGHPVRFGHVCGQDLMALSGDGGAAALLRTYAVQTLPVDDPGSVLDIDTLADLQRAQSLLHG